jgi:hypothetical protein
MSFKPRLINSEKMLLVLTPRVRSILIGLILSENKKEEIGILE